MIHHSIASAGISDLVAFNQQLRQLIDAGLHLQWPPGQAAKDPISGSEQAARELVYKTSQGEGLYKVILADATIPMSYKLSFLSWLVTNRSPKAFDLLKPVEVQAPATQLRSTRYFYLWLILLMAIAVFVIWLFTGGTALRNLYLESRFPPGPIGSITIYCLEHIFLPLERFYVPISTVLFLALTYAIYAFTRRAKRLSTRSRILNATDESLANRVIFFRTLLSQNIPIEEVVSIYQFANEKSLPKPVLNPQVETDELSGASENEISINQSSYSEHQDAPSPNDSVLLHAYEWGLEQRLARAVKTDAIIKPQLTYAIVGGLIVFIVALIVFLPNFEFIHSIDVSKRL